MSKDSHVNVFFLGTLSAQFIEHFAKEFEGNLVDKATVKPSPPLDRLAACSIMGFARTVTKVVEHVGYLQDQGEPPIHENMSFNRQIVELKLAECVVPNPTKKILVIAAGTPAEHNDIVAQFDAEWEELFDMSLYLDDPALSKGSAGVKYNAPFEGKKNEVIEYLDETGETEAMAMKLLDYLTDEVVKLCKDKGAIDRLRFSAARMSLGEATAAEPPKKDDFKPSIVRRP